MFHVHCFRILAIIAIALIVVTSCIEEAQKVFASRVILDQLSVDILLGQTIHLSAVIELYVSSMPAMMKEQT